MKAFLWNHVLQTMFVTFTVSLQINRIFQFLQCKFFVKNLLKTIIVLSTTPRVVENGFAFIHLHFYFWKTTLPPRFIQVKNFRRMITKPSVTPDNLALIIQSVSGCSYLLFIIPNATVEYYNGYEAFRARQLILI